ncbi:hypothetical protein, partial [Myxococcus sp. CA040A]|uniref:hypothetical protein n=1 Tax=Myxococcus sp. CA040A TaxID=2741738 RepID=UPI001C2DBEFB
LQALLVCASQRSLAGAFSKIDCGFRNPSLLLGLAIWFSKTEPLVSSATFCYFVSVCCSPLPAGGSHLLFRSASAVNFALRPFRRPPKSSAPPSGFRCFLREGRGFYLSAASRVNRCFVDSLAASALLLPGFFVGVAASTTAASSVNSLR